MLAQIKSEKDSVDTLIQPVETADRLFQELQALQNQVDDLESKLDVSVQGAKSLEEIVSELKILENNRSVKTLVIKDSLLCKQSEILIISWTYPTDVCFNEF